MKLIILDTTYELKPTPESTFFIAHKLAYKHFASATLSQGVINDKGETAPLMVYNSIRIEGQYYRFFEAPAKTEE